jgi:AcrR family transcriptional regulator
MQDDTNVKKRRMPVQMRSRKMKTAIMEAAHEVMRERGIRAITSNAVAEHAGIKIGSLYDYFPNKEAIIAEIYEEKLARIRVFLEKGTQQIETPNWEDQLAQLIRETWAYQLSIGFDRIIVDAAYYYEDLLRIARAHSQMFASTYARLLRRLGSTWSEKTLLDLGVSIYTLVNSTWSYWRLTDTDNPVGIERQIMLTIKLVESALEQDKERRPRRRRPA